MISHTEKNRLPKMFLEHNSILRLQFKVTNKIMLFLLFTNLNTPKLHLTFGLIGH